MGAQTRDPRIYRLVMSQPIPDRLIRALAEDQEWRLHQPTLNLLCQGYTSKQIAAELRCSEQAVKTRLKTASIIMRARNRAHLAALLVHTKRVYL